MTAQLFPFTDPIVAQATPPKEMVHAEGAYVTDSHGKTYFDAVSGLWCASLGFTPERLQKAAADQMGKLGYYHSFMGRTSSVTNTLAERLVEKLPAGLEHVFFGTSGSEAVDTAIKFACYYQNARGKPGKTRIIARERGYHGSGMMSAAATGMDYCHTGFTLPMDAILRTGSAHHFSDANPGESESDFAARRVQELEDMIIAEKADTICAFIGEPLMGSGGVFVPPKGYWEGVQEVLRRHDILLIADEIITGFGRTGQWFGCDTFGIKPDLMTMAKQLTGAMFPLSAVAMTKEVHAGIAKQAHDLGTFGHGVTYGGHPVGAAVALEALAIYDEMDLPTHVARLGAHLRTGLEPIRTLPGVGHVRCVGLVSGVEFMLDGQPDLARAARVGKIAEAKGVLFRIINNTIAISPPYISTPDQIAHACDVLAQAITESADRT